MGVPRKRRIFNEVGHLATRLGAESIGEGRPTVINPAHKGRRPAGFGRKAGT